MPGRWPLCMAFILDIYQQYYLFTFEFSIDEMTREIGFHVKIDPESSFYRVETKIHRKQTKNLQTETFIRLRTTNLISLGSCFFLSCGFFPLYFTTVRWFFVCTHIRNGIYRRWPAITTIMFSFFFILFVKHIICHIGKKKPFSMHFLSHFILPHRKFISTWPTWNIYIYIQCLKHMYI